MIQPFEPPGTIKTCPSLSFRRDLGTSSLTMNTFAALIICALVATVASGQLSLSQGTLTEREGLVHLTSTLR
jgi:hypothetical protein